MALFIEDKNQDTWVEWYVGEPLPNVQGRVVRFQADGDELEFFLSAMKRSKHLLEISERMKCAENLNRDLTNLEGSGRITS